MTSIKKVFQRANLLAVAFALALSVLVGVAPAHAAATVVWTGTAGDNKLGTAGNWQGGVAPVAGDIIRFATKPASSTVNLTNDLGVALGGVQAAQVTGTNSNKYVIDTISLQDGAVLSDDTPGADCDTPTRPINVLIDTVTSTGSIIDSAYMANAAVLHITGSYTSNTGYISAGTGSNVDGSVILQTPVANVNSQCGGAGGGMASGSSITGFTIHGLVVQNGASVDLADTAFPITFGGGSGSVAPHVSFFGNVDSNYDYVDTTYTVSGALTLSSNANFLVGPKTTVKVTGTVSGSGAVQRDPSSDTTGVLQVSGQNLVNQPKTTPLNGDDAATSYTVVDKETAILNGTRSYLSVQSGGLLKGNGTVSGMYINAGGTVSPGNSPGKITVTNSFNLYGTYQAEILNKDAYDQIVAQSVWLGSNPDYGTLNLVFLPGGSVTQGDTFTIINNTGTDPVNGIFKGLPEGTKMTVGNAVFVISYKGGDGNDVVLTALTTAKAPAAPNTGFFAPILASPVLVAVLGLASIVALAIVRKTAKR